MKNLTFALVAAAAIILGACNGAPKATFNSDVDSLGYAFGHAQAQGLQQYMAMRLGMDSTYIDDFLKGVIDGTKMADDTTKQAYIQGVQIGQAMATQWLKGVNYQLTGNDSTQLVTLNNIVAGFIAGAKGDNSVMTAEQSQQTFEEGMRNIHTRLVMEQYGENKVAGEKKMAEIAQQPGVQALGNGVYYEVLTEGNGPVAQDNNTVAIKYVGTLLVEGTEFDRSRGDEPYKSRPGQFIPGFAAALKAMPAGSKWKVYIPQDQAYGENPAGELIKPFSALVFELELLSVE